MGKDAFAAKYPSITVYNTVDADRNPISLTIIDGHSVMAGSFLTPLANAIQSMNSSFTPAYAMSLAQGGIVVNSLNDAANLAERTSSSDAKGTRCPK